MNELTNFARVLAVVALLIGPAETALADEGQKGKEASEKPCPMHDLASQALIEAATDTYNNLEIARRLDAGDIEAAKGLIREVIDADRVELEQLGSSGHVSDWDRQRADRAAARAREYLKLTARP